MTTSSNDFSQAAQTLEKITKGVSTLISFFGDEKAHQEMNDSINNELEQASPELQTLLETKIPNYSKTNHSVSAIKKTARRKNFRTGDLGVALYQVSQQLLIWVDIAKKSENNARNRFIHWFIEQCVYCSNMSNTSLQLQYIEFLISILDVMASANFVKPHMIGKVHLKDQMHHALNTLIPAKEKAELAYCEQSAETILAEVQRDLVSLSNTIPTCLFQLVATREPWEPITYHNLLFSLGMLEQDTQEMVPCFLVAAVQQILGIPIGTEKTFDEHASQKNNKLSANRLTDLNKFLKDTFSENANLVTKESKEAQNNHRMAFLKLLDEDQLKLSEDGSKVLITLSEEKEVISIKSGLGPDLIGATSPIVAARNKAWDGVIQNLKHLCLVSILKEKSTKLINLAKMHGDVAIYVEAYASLNSFIKMSVAVSSAVQTNCATQAALLRVFHNKLSGEGFTVPRNRIEMRQHAANSATTDFKRYEDGISKSSLVAISRQTEIRMKNRSTSFEEEKNLTIRELKVEISEIERLKRTMDIPPSESSSDVNNQINQMEAKISATPSTRREIKDEVLKRENANLQKTIEDLKTQLQTFTPPPGSISFISQPTSSSGTNQGTEIKTPQNLHEKQHLIELENKVKQLQENIKQVEEKANSEKVQYVKEIQGKLEEANKEKLKQVEEEARNAKVEVERLEKELLKSKKANEEFTNSNITLEEQKRKNKEVQEDKAKKYNLEDNLTTGQLLYSIPTYLKFSDRVRMMKDSPSFNNKKDEYVYRYSREPVISYINGVWKINNDKYKNAQNSRRIYESENIVSERLQTILNGEKGELLGQNLAAEYGSYSDKQMTTNQINTYLLREINQLGQVARRLKDDGTRGYGSHEVISERAIRLMICTEMVDRFTKIAHDPNSQFTYDQLEYMRHVLYEHLKYQRVRLGDRFNAQIDELNKRMVLEVNRAQYLIQIKQGLVPVEALTIEKRIFEKRKRQLYQTESELTKLKNNIYKKIQKYQKLNQKYQKLNNETEESVTIIPATATESTTRSINDSLTEESQVTETQESNAIESKSIIEEIFKDLRELKQLENTLLQENTLESLDKTKFKLLKSWSGDQNDSKSVNLFELNEVNSQRNALYTEIKKLIFDNSLSQESKEQPLITLIKEFQLLENTIQELQAATNQWVDLFKSGDSENIKQSATLKATIKAEFQENGKGAQIFQRLNEIKEKSLNSIKDHYANQGSDIGFIHTELNSAVNHAISSLKNLEKTNTTNDFVNTIASNLSSSNTMETIEEEKKENNPEEKKKNYQNQNNNPSIVQESIFSQKGQSTPPKYTPEELKLAELVIISYLATDSFFGGKLLLVPRNLAWNTIRYNVDTNSYSSTLDQRATILFEQKKVNNLANARQVAVLLDILDLLKTNNDKDLIQEKISPAIKDLLNKFSSDEAESGYSKKSSWRGKSPPTEYASALIAVCDILKVSFPTNDKNKVYSNYYSKAIELEQEAIDTLRRSTVKLPDRVTARTK